MEIIFLLVGALLGWIITHLYSRSSSREIRELHSKLSEELREIILSDKRNSLSVKELNELINDRVIDPDDNSPLPYRACPDCGSEKVKRHNSTSPDDEIYYMIGCEDCGWGDWTQ